MTKEHLKVEASTLSGASSRIHQAGVHSKAATEAVLRGATRMGLTAGHKVFAALVDGVIDELRTQLPEDLACLIASYARALLKLDTALNNADQELAKDSRNSGQPSSHAVLEGPGSFSNASIVAGAKKWPVGSPGGQCRVFVYDVVLKATHGKVDLSAYSDPQHNYFAALEQHGFRIESTADLQPGDVVQIGAYETDSKLHTFIVAGFPYRDSGGAWLVNVIDSNHDGHGTVDEYPRPVALSDEERAYRLGTV